MGLPMVVTKEMKRAEANFLEKMLVHPAGFAIDVGGAALCIVRNEKQNFEITWEEPIEGPIPPTGSRITDSVRPEIQEYLRVFIAAEDAAIFFVEKRHELGLGYDYESGILKVQNGISSSEPVASSNPTTA